MKAALLTETSGDKIKCLLCAHHCTLKEGQTGICRVRKNINGQLAALSADRVAATHSDPIEKKPLYHFLPASTSFSIAAMGCNFSCKFCQNHSLSMVKSEDGIYGENISPRQLVQTALAYNSKSIAYTYTEPTIYFELMMETAKLAFEAGIKNVMVTNGFMSGKALEVISPYLHAANVDLKAFSETFYKTYCRAGLAPVLETIRGMKQTGIWLELTTLLIPGLNDDPLDVDKLISFILSVDESIPWHVSRFYPQHKMTDVSPTDPRVMFNFLDKAGEMGLKYRYAGNVHSDHWSDTRCPECEEILIQRSGYSTQVTGLENGKCRNCNHSIAGVWS